MHRLGLGTRTLNRKIVFSSAKSNIRASYTVSATLKMASQSTAAPESRLARYRRLSPSAGVLVSPFQLGGMNIGDKWTSVKGLNREDSFKLLDAFSEAGGNFIDTANFYQNGESEQILGEWMEARRNRQELVIATKYTAGFRQHEPNVKQATLVGNSYKSMVTSLEASLKKLRTNYVDIFYIHWWDYTSSIEEVMDGLHNLVVQGKVLYLGASNLPAWVVSEANRYARDHGRSTFVIYQGAWNVFSRDFERDIIPMARAHGMALAPWNVPCQGKIRTDEEEEARRQSGEKGRLAFTATWERSEDQKKMCKALEKVAAEVGAKSIRSVALAYHMQKTKHVFPLIGGRKVEQMHENLDALNITLSPEQIQYIESILPFDVGGPHAFIGNGTDLNRPLRNVVWYEADPVAEPIRPSQS